jgi:hypothetical protein
MPVTSRIKLKTDRGMSPQNYSHPQVREFLDKAARKLKVAPPTKFEYEDPEYFIQTIGREFVRPKMLKRWKQQKEWHEASTGLQTFTALLGHFRAEGTSGVPLGVDHEGFLHDLESFHAILLTAAKKKDSFRIETFI